MLLCLHCHTRSHTHSLCLRICQKQVHVHDCTAHDLDRGGRQFRFFSAFWHFKTVLIFRSSAKSGAAMAGPAATALTPLSGANITLPAIAIYIYDRINQR